MAFSLDDLVTDERLARLFSGDPDRNCALQLWVLQVKAHDITESRILYGRLLPYNHSSNSWHAPADDRFESVGEHRAQVIRLSLYIKSAKAAALIKQLADGYSLVRISDDSSLELSESLAERVGTTAFSRHLAYRPVSYLVNRDAADGNEDSSPHGNAGAFSASLTPTHKTALFRFGDQFDAALAAFIVRRLDTDTGLDFGGRDLSRIGDVELLVFPTLDDSERELLIVNWKHDFRALAVRLNTIHLPRYDTFHVRLSVLNGNRSVYSRLAVVSRCEGNEFECEFEVPEQLRSIGDGTELEIYGSHSGDTKSSLCCRWSMAFVREITFSGHVLGREAGSVRLGWLERVTQSAAASERVQAVQTINQGGLGFSGRAGGRIDDPWISANADLRSLLARIHPPRSRGRFFERLSEGDGLGRLEFVEWIKNLLVAHQDHEVLIFDPYFEDAGIGLVVPNAGSRGDYIVFTTLTKSAAEETRSKSTALSRFRSKWCFRPKQQPTDTRINNLLASCEQLKPLMKAIRLRVYGLKSGALHDRYILIAGPDGLPVAGFNLSNSIQKANENYPLLITPIPPDALLNVFEYASRLLETAIGAEANASSAQLLFDSKRDLDVSPRRVEPLGFLDRDSAGDVLAAWADKRELRRLKGKALRQKMRELGLLDGESLVLTDADGFERCLHQAAGDFANFRIKWEVLAEILAHSHAGDLTHVFKLSSQAAFLSFLRKFLSDSFERVPDPLGAPLLEHVGSTYFQMSIETLLASPNRLENFAYFGKYAALSWPEYFAVRILWQHDPEALISMTEVQVRSDSQTSNVVKLFLLSQIVGEIALGIHVKIDDVHRDRLIRSPNGLLKWLGLHALESQLERPDGVRDVVQYAASFSQRERVQVLSWMIQRAARSPKSEANFRGLVASLHEALPSNMVVEDAKLLVNSLRGHRAGIGWAEPWLFQDVMYALLEKGRVSADSLCDIWVAELRGTLEQALSDEAAIFRRSLDGRVIEVAAFLFGRSGVRQQEVAVRSLQSVLKRVRRDVQQPLASTSNWSKWNTSVAVALWIFAFTRWVARALPESGETSEGLERLSADARSLALYRPIAEWTSDRGAGLAELARFVEEAAA